MVSAIGYLMTEKIIQTIIFIYLYPLKLFAKTSENCQAKENQINRRKTRGPFVRFYCFRQRKFFLFKSEKFKVLTQVKREKKNLSKFNQIIG